MTAAGTISAKDEHYRTLLTALRVQLRATRESLIHLNLDGLEADFARQEQLSIELGQAAIALFGGEGEIPRANRSELAALQAAVIRLNRAHAALVAGGRRAVQIWRNLLRVHADDNPAAENEGTRPGYVSANGTLTR